MSMQVEATYENGVLKLVQTLPLNERQRVIVTVEPAHLPEQGGLVRWPRDAETLRALLGDRIAATAN